VNTHGIPIRKAIYTIAALPAVGVVISKELDVPCGRSEEEDARTLQTLFSNEKFNVGTKFLVLTQYARRVSSNCVIRTWVCDQTGRVVTVSEHSD
jgi:hypothetical protein